jgi:4-carboxymuconolactone decarboxylase
VSAPNETAAQKLIGDFAPKMVSLTDDVLFGDVWERAELAPRDRSLITVAALIANGNAEQLPGHLALARQNGLTETELKEVIIHLAFYAGWPRAMSPSRSPNKPSTPKRETRLSDPVTLAPSRGKGAGAHDVLRRAGIAVGRRARGSRLGGRRTARRGARPLARVARP